MVPAISQVLFSGKAGPPPRPGTTGGRVDVAPGGDVGGDVAATQPSAKQMKPALPSAPVKAFGFVGVQAVEPKRQRWLRQVVPPKSKPLQAVLASQAIWQSLCVAALPTVVVSMPLASTHCPVPTVA